MAITATTMNTTMMTMGLTITGITTIRIAEFAWSLVEPQEGQFTFAFWDEFLDLAEAKGMKVIFGTPTYYAGEAWPVKKWVDESRPYQLAGTLGGAFATADYLQGGAGQAVEFLIRSMLVKGMLVYSGGSALGQPYIHLGPVALHGREEESEPLFETFGRRMALKAAELFEP